MAYIRGWAAHGAGQKLEPFTYDPGRLDSEEVEIAVEYCGLCHSDLSILNNDWSLSQYPLIPGHEVVGRVVAAGDHVKGLQIGQRVGVGWNFRSCMHCHECLTGNNNLCLKAEPTIVGHYGGFAERVRSHWAWAIPLPDTLDISSAGPLLCGGITVFAPLATFAVKPTDRVGSRRYRWLGSYGPSICQCLGLRSNGLYLEPIQIRRSAETGRAPGDVEPGRRVKFSRQPIRSIFCL